MGFVWAGEDDGEWMVVTMANGEKWVDWEILGR